MDQTGPDLHLFMKLIGQVFTRTAYFPDQIELEWKELCLKNTKTSLIQASEFKTTRIDQTIQGWTNRWYIPQVTEAMTLCDGGREAVSTSSEYNFCLVLIVALLINVLHTQNRVHEIRTSIACHIRAQGSVFSIAQFARA